MDDVNLWWVAIQKQILDPDVHEFVHPGTGLEQGLDHQPVFCSGSGSLNQAFDRWSGWGGPLALLCRNFGLR